MKQKILDFAGSGPKGDGVGLVLLVVAIICAVGFFGFIFYDAYRMRKRARQVRGRGR
jgi:hypothetical protein